MSVAFVDEYDDLDGVEEIQLVEEIVSLTPKEYVNRSKISNKHYMLYFFANKKMHTGEKIQEKDLFEPKKLWNVMNLDLCTAVDRVYATLDKLDRCKEEIHNKEYKYEDENEDEDDRKNEESIAKVLEVLELLGEARLPQQMFGGMLLLYLELCEGIKFES